MQKTRRTFRDGQLVKSETLERPDPPTEDEKIAAWLADNPYLEALAREVFDTDRAACVAGIKSNMRRG
jgi:hypothetical protein